MSAERISLADERNIFDSIGLGVKLESLKLLITELLNQRKMVFFVRGFLVPQKIMSVIAVNIKESNIKVSFVTDVELR